MVFAGTAGEGAASASAGSQPAERFSHLGIYAGAFDAGQPGGIRWNKTPELSPGVNQRVMGFAVCNGSLYAVTQKRLYQRVSDGPNPQWRLLHDFRDDVAIRAAYGDRLDPGWVYYDHMRALHTVPNPSGAGEALTKSTLVSRTSVMTTPVAEASPVLL